MNQSLEQAVSKATTDTSASLKLEHYQGDPDNFYGEIHRRCVTFIFDAPGMFHSDELLDAINKHARKLAKEWAEGIADQCEREIKCEKLEVDDVENFCVGMTGQKISVTFSLWVTASFTTYDVSSLAA